MVDQVHVLAGPSGHRTVFTHGHYWTMFNAPDPRSPWNTLPVGHFVTRAFSYMMAKKLEGTDKTVADFPNMGYPDGFNIWTSSGRCIRPSRLTSPPCLLNYVSGASGMSDPDRSPFPDGATTTIAEREAALRQPVRRLGEEGERQRQERRPCRAGR